MSVKAFKRGDPCARCGGTMVARPVLSDEDYARVFHPKDPVAAPHGVDTASPQQRAEFGDLFTCDKCGMDYRFPPLSDDEKQSAAERETGESSGERADDTRRRGERGGQRHA